MNWCAVFCLAVVLSACTEDSKTSDETVRAADAEYGRRLYLAQCISCHNSNPSKDGPIGPAVKGSSEALLEARVLRASYPPGYTPKRNTKVMPPQPFLKSAIPDLAAFLADDDKKKPPVKQ
jgi:mono/diheme cytochrome c family protein